MKLAVIGTGYVGLVTGVCLADVGHVVTCVDIDENKIRRLQQGIIDIYEPGLDELAKSVLHNGHLVFTTQIDEAMQGADAVFIAVGTPPCKDGSTDLSHVLAAAADIGNHLAREALVIIKSTVPVGTCARVETAINQLLAQRHTNFSIGVVSNPEFLKEGAAIADFTRPDRIIIGCNSSNASALMHDIYAPYNRKRDKIIVMDVASAELTKYAANAMLATKISFINEIANIAEKVGADIESVRLGIGADPRIGYDFIYAGCGYGGSCFPKDVKSLANVAKENGHASPLLNAVTQVNENQKTILFKRLSEHFSGDLKGKTFAVWGLAFKPNTNDIREAPSRVLMESLWQAGATVRAYDPIAMPEIQSAYGDRRDLWLCENKDAAIDDADALIICTEWKEFRVPDYEHMKALLKHPVIVDGRNLYEPVRMQEHGFIYYGIGRGESCRP